MGTSFKTVFDIRLPRSWVEMTQSQLRIVYRLLAHDLDKPDFLLSALLRLGKIKVLSRGEMLWLVKIRRKTCVVRTRELAALANSLSWLLTPPGYPRILRPCRLIKLTAADEYDMIFGDYLELDNLYTGYLVTRDQNVARQFAEKIYRVRFPWIHLSKIYEIAAVYWFIGLKARMARMHPNFYVSGGPAASDPAKAARENTNAQLRALTKGDVTKEEAVLNMPVLRALAELDALAREYQEYKKSMAKTKK